MMKDLHLSVGDDLVGRLDTLARKLSLSRAYLLREALAEYLGRKERDLVSQEMARYAAEMGPYSREFVDETEPLVDRMLRENTEW